MSDNVFCIFCEKNEHNFDKIFNDVKITIDYLQDLLRDQKNLMNFGDSISESSIQLLKREIMLARHVLFHKTEPEITNEVANYKSDSNNGLVTLSEKIFVPVYLNPTYNFVGRIIGPSGSSIRLLEKKFNCKIHVRGRGSIRIKQSKEVVQQPCYTEDDLHIVITIENVEETVAHERLSRIKQYFHNLFQESVKKTIAEDEEKQNQLLEYAIIKGTYREIDFKNQQRLKNRKRKLSSSSISSPSSSTSSSSLSSNPQLPTCYLPIINGRSITEYTNFQLHPANNNVALFENQACITKMYLNPYNNGILGTLPLCNGLTNHQLNFGDLANLKF